MALDILPMLPASWEYRRSLVWVAEVGASVVVFIPIGDSHESACSS